MSKKNRNAFPKIWNIDEEDYHGIRIFLAKKEPDADQQLSYLKQRRET